MSLTKSQSFNGPPNSITPLKNDALLFLKKSHTLPNLSSTTLRDSALTLELSENELDTAFLDRISKLKLVPSKPAQKKKFKNGTKTHLSTVVLFQASEYRHSAFGSEASFEKKLSELASYKYPHQNSSFIHTHLSSSQHSEYGFLSASFSSLNSFRSSREYGGTVSNASGSSLNHTNTSPESQHKNKCPTPNHQSDVKGSVSNTEFDDASEPDKGQPVQGLKLMSDSILGINTAALPDSMLLAAGEQNDRATQQNREVASKACTKKNPLAPIENPEESDSELIAVQPEYAIQIPYLLYRAPRMVDSSLPVRDPAERLHQTTARADSYARANIDQNSFTFPLPGDSKKNDGLYNSSKLKLWKWKKGGPESSSFRFPQSTSTSKKHYPERTAKQPSVCSLPAPSPSSLSIFAFMGFDKRSDCASLSESPALYDVRKPESPDSIDSVLSNVSQASSNRTESPQNSKEASPQHESFNGEQISSGGLHMAFPRSSSPLPSELPKNERTLKESFVDVHMPSNIRLQQRRCATVGGPPPVLFSRFDDSTIKHKNAQNSRGNPTNSQNLTHRNKDNRCSSYHYYMMGKRQHYTPKQVIETSTVLTRHTSEAAWVNPIRGEVNFGQEKINQYMVLRSIGSGSYGRVVLVQSELDNRYYACKIMSKSRLRKKFRWTNVDSLKQQRPMSSCGYRSTSSDVSKGFSSYSSSPLTSRPQSPVSPVLNYVSTSLDSSSSTAFYGQGSGLLSGTSATWKMEREVAILKKISKHPNINALIEVLDDIQEDNLYLIFELCEYGPVMKIRPFGKVRPFSEKLARQYFRDAVLGLEYLHHKRIIHCDIKPENLLLTAERHLQIADFGISHMFDERESDPLVLSTNMSPIFAPPEACDPNNTHVRGKAVDIWGLGVTLYCFMHGYCPFEAASPLELCQKIMHSKLQLNNQLSPELQDLLVKMLCKDPKLRLSLANIKTHLWVTEKGTNPMLSTEKNCIFEDVTDDEVAHALRPARSMLTKLLKKLKKSATKSSKTK